MLIAGAICLVIAAVAAYFYYDSRSTLRAAQRTETLTCGEISELSEAAKEAVGAGAFSHACEVVGVGRGAENGTLKAPESDIECLWHRTVVTEHYDDWERDSDGDRRRVRKTRQLSSHQSELGFVVEDDSGTIVVDPRGADMDGEEKVVDRMRNANEGNGGGGGLAQIAASFGASLLGGDRTVAIQHEEWVLRTGARLYVLGEARDDGGRLRLTKPKKGKLVISTRSEEELTDSARKTMRIASVAGVVFAVVGLGLLIAGALAAA